MANVGEVKLIASIDTSAYKKGEDEIEKSNDRIEGSTEKVSRNSEKSWGRIGATIGVVAGLATTVFQKAFSVIENSIGSAVKRVDTLNNSTRTFENMGFTAEAVASAMGALQKSIKGLPTPLDAAVSGVQLLASATEDVGKAQKIYTSLNNAIIGFGGSTEQVKNAITQISQAFAGGRIDAETWNSMLDSGLGPTLNAIAKIMGKTSKELKTGLSEGTVSVGQFQDALISLNENGGGGLKSLQKIALDATAGIGTGWENFQTSIVRGTAEIIKAIGSEKISKAMGDFGSIFEGGLKSIAEFVKGAQVELPKIATAIATTIQAGRFDVIGETLGKSIRFGIDAALNGIRIGIDSVKNFFGGINFVEVGKFIVTKIIPGIAIGLIAGLGELDLVNDILKPLGDNIVPVLLGILSIAFAPSKLLGPLTRIISKIPILGPMVNWLIKAIRGLVGPIREAFASLFNNAGGVIRNALTKLGNIFNVIRDLFLAPIRTVIDDIAMSIRLIPTSIRESFVAVGNLLKTMGVGIGNIFKFIFQNAFNVVKAIFQPLIGFFNGIWNGIRATAGATFNSMSDAFQSFFIRIQLMFQALPETAFKAFMAVRGAIENVFGNIANWFGNIFNTAWTNIRNAFSGVAGFFGNIWMSITRWFTDIGTTVGNAIGNAFKGVINSVLRGAVNIVNGFVDSINGAISVINRIPGVKLSSLGKLPIPQLATGGIVSSATLAMIGEGSEPEAVIPLSKLDSMLNGGSGNGTGGGDYNVSVTINSTFPPSKQEQRQIAQTIEDRLIEIRKSKGMSGGFA